MMLTYGGYGDLAGFTKTDVAEMSREQKIQIMVEWFSQQFEDPQHDTPYNEDLGGYVFLWGGPFDASNQIQAEFSDVVDFDTMMFAVDQVQEDGTVDWAPTTGGDFYEHPEDDGFATDEIVDGDGEWPPVIVEKAQIPSEPEARADVMRRLGELEDLLKPLMDQIKAEAQAAPMMGHNNPPKELEIVQAIPREEWLKVMSAIDRISKQAASDQPDLDTVAANSNRLLNAANSLAGWIASRANAAADAGVAVGAGYSIANPEAVKTALANAANAVQVWLASLPWPI